MARDAKGTQQIQEQPKLRMVCLGRAGSAKSEKRRVAIDASNDHVQGLQALPVQQMNPKEAPEENCLPKGSFHFREARSTSLRGPPSTLKDS